MNCYPKVEKGVVALGWYSSGRVRMCGSSSPIVPCGSYVDKMVFKACEGQHAMIFFSRNDEPQRKGSGKTAYLDETTRLECCVFLMWQEGEITIAKEDYNMSVTELSRFNPFTRSGTDVKVVDANRKIAYVVPAEGMHPSDPAWIYKKVPGDAMAAYIAKHSTLAELDATAESEIAARNELAELRETTRRADNDQARAVNDMLNIASSSTFFAAMVREFLNNKFISNCFVRFIARCFGTDGTQLRRIISNSGENIIEPKKLMAAVRAELR